jgi:hypothetical protein
MVLRIAFDALYDAWIQSALPDNVEPCGSSQHEAVTARHVGEEAHGEGFVERRRSVNLAVAVCSVQNRWV